jgi:hypothetical protein
MKHRSNLCASGLPVGAPADGGRTEVQVTTNLTAQSIAFSPEAMLCGTSVECRRRDQGLEYWARTLFKSREFVKALAKAERIAVVIQDRDLAMANQKAPFAADTVIEPGPRPKSSNLTNRPDNKFVAGSPRTPRTEASWPNVHELAQRQVSDQRKAFGFGAESECHACRDLETLRRNTMQHCNLLSAASTDPPVKGKVRHPACCVPWKRS